MKRFLYFVIFATLPTWGVQCLPIVKNMDRVSTTSDYKDISYLSYQHKIKREYIAKALIILSKLRKNSAKIKKNIAYTLQQNASIPLGETIALESDALSSANKINLSALQAMIYKSIKKEIKEEFETN